jgi:hypothetical protein
MVMTLPAGRDSVKRDNDQAVHAVAAQAAALPHLDTKRTKPTKEPIERGSIFPARGGVDAASPRRTLTFMLFVSFVSKYDLGTSQLSALEAR